MEQEPRKQPDNKTWIMRSIVTVQSTVIILMTGFFATGYGDLVTHAELKQLPYPYLVEKAVIQKHIRYSEDTLRQVTRALEGLNERITTESHAADLRLSLLEAKGRSSNKR